jgi:hypothetical protein
VSPFAGTPLEGTLYDIFTQPFRDRVQQIGGFVGSPLRVYDHLDPTRETETRVYLGYAGLSADRLVDEFIGNFLEIGANVDREVVRGILNNVVSRNIGRLEIELLMTKISVRRSFWNEVKREANSRKRRLQLAIRDFNIDSEEKVDELFSSSYLVSNLFKFLVKPDDPGSVTAEMLRTYKIVNDSLYSFFLGEEKRIEDFLNRIGSEVQWRKDLTDSILIDVKSSCVSGVYRLLDKIESVVLMAIGDSAFANSFSIMKFVDVGKNYFRHGSMTHTADSSALISIKFSSYNNGIASCGGHYCYTRKHYEDRKKRNVGCQQKTVYGSVFHELDHALHWFEGRIGSGQLSLDAMYGEDGEHIAMWKNDEEFLTISGLSYDNGWIVDPVSCAAFCRSEVKRSVNFNIRCFHKVPPTSKIGVGTNPGAIPIFAAVSDSELLE